MPDRSLPLSQLFSQPSSIAVLASIGIHGLLFAFLPLLPSPSEALESEPPDPVSVVELTPAERQRLPDLDRSPISRLPSTPFDSEQFGLTTPPGGSADLFPDVVPGGSSRQSRVPQTPSRAPTGRRGVLPRTRTFIPSVPQPRSQPRPQRRVPGSIPNNLPSVQPDATRPRSQPGESPDSLSGQFGISQGIPELDQLGIGSPQARAPESGQASDLETPASPTPSPDSDEDEPTGETPERPDDSAAPETATSPSPSPSPEATDEPEPPIAANPTPEPTPPVADDPLRAEVAELQRLYSYRPDNTSQEAATRFLEEWLATAREASGNPELVPEAPPITVSVDYPLRACLPEPPENASVAALVNEAGELVEPPTLTKSTGYLGLNQRALDAVQSYDFPEAESVKAYTFRVDVNYDSEQCLSLPSQAETG